MSLTKPKIKLSHMLATIMLCFSYLPFSATSHTLSPNASTNNSASTNANVNTALAEQSSTMTVNDGPYVAIQSDHYLVSWVCKNKLNSIKVKLDKLPYKFNQCGLKATIDKREFTTDKVKYKGDFKIAAFSDMHGQLDLAQELLTNNGIIDKKGNWHFGNGHLVITGDIFDRGPKVTEALWFIYQLEQQAEQAGGKIHFLLGNHEVMVLNGDLRYLHPKYNEVAKLYKQPFEQLFGKETLLGQWLRSKSVLVKINNALFAHGGFHPDLAKDKLKLKYINQVFRDNLVKANLKEPRDGLGKYLHKTNGPVWYRGYFKDDGATSEELDIILKHFKINHLIVGHTSMNTVESHHQGRVIAIDSSLKRGQYGELLLIKGEQMWRATLEGKKMRL